MMHVSPNTLRSLQTSKSLAALAVDNNRLPLWVVQSRTGLTRIDVLSCDSRLVARIGLDRSVGGEIRVELDVTSADAIAAISAVLPAIVLAVAFARGSRPDRIAIAGLLATLAISGSAEASDTFPGTTITGTSGSLIGSNAGATSEPGEPTTYGGGAVNSIWYSWMAPANGTLVVETCSSTTTNFDTTLKTYTGNAVNALTTVAANDDICATTFNSTYASRNTVTVTAGTTYRIQVDGYANATGAFLLSWDFTAPSAQFTLTKTADASSVSAPGTITYTITVDNSGNRRLTNPVISDTLLFNGSGAALTSGPTMVSGDLNGDGRIDTSETWVYTATYAVTQADIDTGGVFSNTVTFDTFQFGPVTSAPATTTITQSPALSIVKSGIVTTDGGAPGEADAGDVVTYTYAVSNTGNVTISGVTVGDSHNGSGSPPVPGSETGVIVTGGSTDSVQNGSWDTLRPGDQIEFAATYTVTQQDVDTLQ